MLDGFVETRVRCDETRGEIGSRAIEQGTRALAPANLSIGRASSARHVAGDPVAFVLDADPCICQAARATAECADCRFESFASAAEFLESPKDAGEITVKAHRGSVMRKIRARSFASLVNMAVKLGSAAT